MLIEPAIRVAPVKPEIASTLLGYVSDDSHLVSTIGLSDIGSGRTAAALNIGNVPLHPILLSTQVQDEEFALAKKVVTNFGLAALKAIGKTDPTALPVVGGIEVGLAGYTAFQSWSDVSSTSIVKPTVDTLKLASKAVNMLPHFAPALKDNPYLTGFTTFVALGDMVYEVCVDAGVEFRAHRATFTESLVRKAD